MLAKILLLVKRESLSNAAAHAAALPEEFGSFEKKGAFLGQRKLKPREVIG